MYRRWKESIHVAGEGEGSKATLVAWLKRRAEADWGAGAVGKHVWVCWCADAEYYRAQVVSYNKDTGKHKVTPTPLTRRVGLRNVYGIRGGILFWMSASEHYFVRPALFQKGRNVLLAEVSPTTFSEAALQHLTMLRAPGLFCFSCTNDRTSDIEQR